MSKIVSALHECTGCEFKTSVQGYFNQCNKPSQLDNHKRFYYTVVDRVNCGEIDKPIERKSNKGTK